MADTDGYNGWSNYETWAMKLWLDNDRGSYESARERALALIAEWTEEGGRAPEGTFADELKDEYEEAMPELDGVWADLLGAAFSEVDWYEIAANIIDEVRAETANQS